MTKTPQKPAKQDPKPVKAATRLSVARVRKLGLDFDSITAAAAHLGWRWDFVKLLEGHADLYAAWRRGQLLRNLRRLARVGATQHQAAHDLEMGLDAFESLVSKDTEAAEIWNAGKLETAIRLKESLLANAEAGKAQAIKQLENILRSEIAHAQFDPRRVAEPLVCEIFGVTRQTLNIWHREKGCPRNAGETTYDLGALVRWFETWVRAKAAGGTLPEVNPLQAVKAERLNLELAARKGELVELAAVKAGIIARERALLAVLEHKPEELAPMLAGKTTEQIKPVLEKFAEDLRREWAAAAEQEVSRAP